MAHCALRMFDALRYGHRAHENCGSFAAHLLHACLPNSLRFAEKKTTSRRNKIDFDLFGRCVFVFAFGIQSVSHASSLPHSPVYVRGNKWCSNRKDMLAQLRLRSHISLSCVCVCVFVRGATVRLIEFFRWLRQAHTKTHIKTQKLWQHYYFFIFDLLSCVNGTSGAHCSSSSLSGETSDTSCVQRFTRPPNFVYTN